jgi:putative flippase GtrA
MHKFKIEATKFTLVGAANFVLTFVVFTAMLKVLLVNYLLSLVTAWVIGMLFSYVLNFSWVFKPEQKVQFRARFVRFFLASVLSIALNMLALRYIVERTDFDPFYVQMALIPFIVVFNFSTAKFWSLKQENKDRKNIMDTHKTKTLREYLNRIDWLALISVALIVVFGITLFTTYFFPIYPDEIQTRIWLSRLPYDFPEKISGAPTCLATFLQPIPLTMYLPSLINWGIHGRLESAPELRPIGFIVAFLWVMGLAFYLNKRVTKSLLENGRGQLSYGLKYLYIAGFIIAIFSIGVFPIFLITNRGEQLILPSVVLLITVFIVNNHLDSKVDLWQKIGLIILYFVAVSLILFGHAKGLFITPLFMIVGWKLFSHFKSRLPLAFAMALLALHITQNFFAYKYAFQCREVPKFEAQLKSFSFDPASLFYDPRHFFYQAYHSLLEFSKYLHQIGFQEYTDASYLPALALATTAEFANILIKLNLATEFLTLMFFLPYQYFRKDVVAGRFITVNLVLLTLFMCLIISGIFNLPKNWYDAGYLYALLLIIIIFFIGENFSGIFQKPVARKIFLYFGTVALLSQAVFIHRNLPAFMAGYTGPGISIVKYDSNKIRDDLLAASRICNIDPVYSKRIVVDDYTYFYFQKSKWPMAITYILAGQNDKSLRQFLSKVDSDGLVVICPNMTLPSPYMSFVKREGNVCCIPKNELKNLLSLP